MEEAAIDPRLLAAHYHQLQLRQQQQQQQQQQFQGGGQAYMSAQQLHNWQQHMASQGLYHAAAAGGQAGVAGLWELMQAREREARDAALGNQAMYRGLGDS